jgi:uracil phosphoribosyltransferase
MTQLRDKRTRPKDFRRLVGETAALMLFDATRDFAVKPRRVVTPVRSPPATRCVGRSCWCPSSGPDWDW